MSQSTIERQRRRIRGATFFERSMKTLPAVSSQFATSEPQGDESVSVVTPAEGISQDGAASLAAGNSLSELDAIRADLAPYKSKYGTLKQAVESMSVGMPWEK